MEPRTVLGRGGRRMGGVLQSVRKRRFRKAFPFSCNTKQGKKTYLSSKLVDQHLHSIPSRVRRQVDGRSKEAAIFGIFELDHYVRDICRCWSFDMLGWVEVELLTLGRREEGCHDEVRRGEGGGWMIYIPCTEEEDVDTPTNHLSK